MSSSYDVNIRDDTEVCHVFEQLYLNIKKQQQLHRQRVGEVDDGEPARKRRRISSDGNDEEAVLNIERSKAVEHSSKERNVDTAFPKDFIVRRVEVTIHGREAAYATPVGVGESSSACESITLSSVTAHSATDDIPRLVIKTQSSASAADIFHLMIADPSAGTLVSDLSWTEKVPNIEPSEKEDNPVWSHFKATTLKDDPSSLQLSAFLLWRKEVMPQGRKTRAIIASISDLLPWKENIRSSMKPRKDAWTVSDFYEAVHIPRMDAETSSAFDRSDLQCDLYPFQRRAVQWLMAREGVAFDDHGQIQTIPTGHLHSPPAYYSFEDAAGRTSLYSPMYSVVTDAPYSYSALRGGILCEEMGLGKTVELIALVTLHRRNMDSAFLTAKELQASGATLIITPPHLLRQWEDEIRRHAPLLRVYTYRGAKSSEKHLDEQEIIDHLRSFDIVLTTYLVLTREIHYAAKPTERSLRFDKVYRARRSPLVQISWWRICLDEAQMIDSGVTSAATVAKLIPRVNSWAVSGTPLKKNLEDLYGLLLFLGYAPFCDSKKLWAEVDKVTFATIIQQIALRHTKDIVRAEMRLPPQNRVVLTMPFTAIEDQNYAELVQQMCTDCGLNVDGSPVIDGLDFDSPTLIGKLREWLRRLRQTCLHPQVGSRNRRRLGRSNQPLKTVDEVLEVMLDQNDTALKAEERQSILLRVRLGLIMANNASDQHRWTNALKLFQSSLKEATEMVTAAKKELADYSHKLAAAKTDVDKTSEAIDEEESQTEKEEGHSRLGFLSRTVRATLEAQHVAAFFVATAFFQLKEGCSQIATPPPDTAQAKLISEAFPRYEKLETEHYDLAKEIRKEMLKEWLDAAHANITLISSLQGRQRCRSMPEIPSASGIESWKSSEKLHQFRDLLHRQNLLLEEVRAKVIEYLCLPLIDEDDSKELSGEEYEESTRKQDELPAYIVILRFLVTDRYRTLTGDADHYREKVKTINVFEEYGDYKYLLQRAQSGTRLDAEDRGHAPELMLELFHKRSGLILHDKDDSLRSIIANIRASSTAIEWQHASGSSRSRAELVLLNEQSKITLDVLREQSKIHQELEKEVELFAKTAQLRDDFYRQLQVISDMVVPFKEQQDEHLDQVAFRQQQADSNACRQRVAQLRTKRRFLLHLQTESSSEDPKICVICQCEFENGVLSICGHTACKECIGLWWRQHRTCPVCRQQLKLTDFHNITYRPQELRAEEEQHAASPSQSRLASGTTVNGDSAVPTSQIYNAIGAQTLREIKSIDLTGSYGTKIDTLAKHLIWIREHDPGAKSLIFSQFSDFLHVMNDALGHFKIGHTTCYDKTGVDRFKHDATVECFLLDAKTDSSGLNLVVATYIFLCEPLVNTAVELQAIARAHRIGQQRPTTVLMYLVSDSVEESIYELSVARRLSHASRTRATMTPERKAKKQQQPANFDLEFGESKELQTGSITTLLDKDRGGGELVEKGDLWNCLFGRQSRRAQATSEEMINGAHGGMPDEVLDHDLHGVMLENVS